MTDVERESTGSAELPEGVGTGVESEEGNGGTHQHQIWLTVFRKQIKEKMKRYMDRQKDNQSPTKTNHWGDTSSKREGNDVIHKNNNKSEYITRLTSLRDSLINQEEANLAQALDRLRLHSLTNKSQSNRLRMRPLDDFMSAPPLIHQRKNMVTTVERFRQIRPSRHQPVVFPLQGRQMLDMTSPRPASEIPISNFGNSTNRSSRSQSEYMAPKPSNTKLEETVQANLQRLIQRTSSIPNIGRKALKHQDDMEPKTKPLLNIRASLQKAHGHHLVSPFLLNTHEDRDCVGEFDSSPSGDHLGVENLSPQAHKLSPALQEDTLDMDKLSQYYHKLISDIDLTEEESNERLRKGFSGNYNNNNNNNKHEINVDGNGNGINNNKFFHYKIKYRHSPFKSSLAKGQQLSSSYSSTISEIGKRHYNSYNSVVSSSGRMIPLSELPNIAPRTMYAYPTDVISDDVMSNVNNYNNNNNNYNNPANSHLYFPEVQQTSYRLQMSETDAASEISKWHGSKSIYRERSKHDLVNSFNNSNNSNNNNNNSNNDSSTSATDGRVKIVVDMPNIIFNAASPENEDFPPNDTEKGQSKGQGQGQGKVIEGQSGQSSNQVVSGVSLKKAVKQHELRQRELQNLLEDVKELNSWTELAQKRSISEGT